MRNKILCIVLVGFLLGLCAPTTWAQQKESQGQLWYFGHYVVKPSMVNELEADLKEMVAYCHEYNYQYTWYVLTTDDFNIYFAIPIKDKGEIDNVFVTWGELAAKVGKPRLEMMKDYWDAYESASSFLIRFRPDLSYTRETKEEEEKNFVMWHMDYIYPGEEMEYEAIHKEWVAMNKRLKDPSPYYVFKGEMTMEGPVYIGAGSAQSIAEWYKQYEAFWEKVGEEGQKRLDRTRKLLRKFEAKHLWLRSELSYIPEKK